MPIADFDALTADIKANNLKEKIMLLDGMILDGYHRWRALVHLGIPIDEKSSREFPQDRDPLAYVLSKNLHRRHLDISQRAIAVATCQKWRGEGQKPKTVEDDDITTGADAPVVFKRTSSEKTNEEMAEIAKVPVQAIKDAKKVIAAGRQDEVVNGTATVASIARPSKPKPAPAPEPEPEHEEPNWQAELKDAHKEIEGHAAVIESLSKTDTAKELVIHRKKFDALSGRLNQCMTTCAEAEKTAKYRGALLERIRKALGVKKDSEIIAAIEALKS